MRRLKLLYSISKLYPDVFQICGDSTLEFSVKYIDPYEGTKTVAGRERENIMNKIGNE